MSNLIDIQVTIDEWKNDFKGYVNLLDIPRDDYNGIMEYIDELPSADVRPVVTCGKCKYGKYTGVSWFCDKHSGHADKFGEDASYHEYHSKYWFCADGEEKNHA